jgi:hypothetical protein
VPHQGQFQSRSGSGVRGLCPGSGSHCYRLAVHIVPRGSQASASQPAEPGIRHRSWRPQGGCRIPEPTRAVVRCPPDAVLRREHARPGWEKQAADSVVEGGLGRVLVVGFSGLPIQLARPHGCIPGPVRFFAAPDGSVASPCNGSRKPVKSWPLGLCDGHIHSSLHLLHGVGRGGVLGRDGVGAGRHPDCRQGDSCL